MMNIFLSLLLGFAITMSVLTGTGFPTGNIFIVIILIVVSSSSMGFWFYTFIENYEGSQFMYKSKPKVKKLPRKMVRFMKDNIYSETYVYSVVKTPKGWDYCWKLRGHSANNYNGNMWSCQNYSGRSKSYCMDQYFNMNYDRVKKLRIYKSQRIIIR